MTGPPEQPEALPGLREAVETSRSKAARTRAAKAAAAEPAPVDPVARVLVDVPLAHLDRTFDYLVPSEMADLAVPGARVKVRFAGQEVGGYLLARAADTDHAGRLTPLRRVVSAERVLSPASRRPGRRPGHSLRRHPQRRPPPGRPSAPRGDRACRVRPARRAGCL